MLSHQVLTIWEGTTNILSLDVLRAILKSKGNVLKSYSLEVTRRCKAVDPTLKASSSKVEESVARLIEFAVQNPHLLETSAREFSYSLARTYMGGYICENIAYTYMDAYMYVGTLPALILAGISL